MAPLVREYDPAWPGWFQSIRARIEPALAGLPHTIEHVGSTAVPGMTAKPVIDVDIIVDRASFPAVKDRLAALGYVHQGDKGIPDREAFDLTDPNARESLPTHFLYVVMRGSPALRDHLLLRDYLRTHPEWVEKLSRHKLDLCRLHGNDRQAYINGKSDMVREIIQLARIAYHPKSSGDMIVNSD